MQNGHMVKHWMEQINFLSTEHLAAFNTLTNIIKIPHKYECFWFPMVLTTIYTNIYESILNNSDKEWWNYKIKNHFNSRENEHEYAYFLLCQVEKIIGRKKVIKFK